MKSSARSSFIAAFILTLIISGVFLSILTVSAQSADLGIKPIQPYLGLGSADIRVTVARIIRVGLGFLGIIAVGLALYAGYLWMTAGGNEEQVGQAKKILINSLIGLAIILASFSIVSYVISKLVGAINMSEDGGDGSGSVGNPYFPNDAFYVHQLPAGGPVCVRNVHPIIIFNRPVIIDAGLQSNIAINRVSDGNIALGAWQYGKDKNTIVFLPNGDCGDGGLADCLQANTEYKLSFKDLSQIKAEGSTATLNCGIKANCSKPINFTTGDSVDRLPPSIFIDAPDPSTPLMQGALVPVKIHYTDDNGVQNLSLKADGWFVGSQGMTVCQKSASIIIDWPTTSLPAGLHTLEATGYDWAGLNGVTSTAVALRPPHCFNGIKDEDEIGVDSGGSCGGGAGDKCAQNSDCFSGYCENGICVDKMRIMSVSPASSAPGDFVSISGLFFGSGAGKVFFASTSNPTDKDWVEAPLAQCPKAPVFSNWTPWQILVTAPVLPVNSSGPIKVITASTTGKDGIERKFADQTNDNFGPMSQNFLFTKDARPGLCAVTPDAATPGGAIAFFGKNLGAQSAKNYVLFGNTKTIVNALTKTGDVNWQNDRINEVLVPFLDPNILGLKVVNSEDRESNGLRFSVLPGASADSPLISSITPSKGARGEYITITGKNFGNVLGQVVFVNDQDEKQVMAGSMSFPQVCGANIWTDNQIIVKFDRELGTIGAAYIVRIVTAENKLSPRDPNFKFSLQAGNPLPGICRVEPVASPVPVAPGTHITITGEYFGNDPEVYFWGTGADRSTLKNRILADKVITSTVAGAQLAIVDPKFGTITGPVIVNRPEDTTFGNEVKFTVNDCVKQNTCSQLGAYQCCSSGIDAGICKPSNELCAGQKRSTAYIWRFATRDIIAVPRVIERCTSETEMGQNIPSPSPNIRWDAGRETGDNHLVCRNAVITIEFSTPLDNSTIGASSIVVNKCSSVDANNCILDKTLLLDTASFQLRTSVGAPGGSRQFLEIKPDKNAVWEDNSWYQVVLRKAIKGFSNGTSSLPLAPDRPCDNDKDSAYCFVFRTDSQDCKLREILVTPSSYWTQVLESPIKYRIYNEPNGNLYYYGNGFSTQRCIMMNMAGYNWQWESANKQYADIYGPANEQRAQVSALANTVNVGVTDNSVNIKATVNVAATPAGPTPKTGLSPLTVDLSKPEIFDYWPKCREACTNAEIGTQFTVAMSNYNVARGLHLFRCFDENCLAMVEVTTTTAPFVNPADRQIITIPHSDLLPNALYKVVVSSTSTPQQLWSQGRLVDPNSQGAPYNREFSWRFNTKKEACKIDHVNLAPKQFIARFFDDRSVFSAQPFSAPDTCSVQGQKLNPWTVSWKWQAKDTAVATTMMFSTLGKSQYCTANCIKKGSDVPFNEVSLYSVCGNGRVEAGEDCDYPDAANGCGLDCRYLGNKDKVTCGDGVVNNKLGEACDLADPATKIGCRQDCRHLGSQQNPSTRDINASVCGNGFLGSGEDCDIGIESDINNASSSLGCSDNCLHLGARLSSTWCFKNNKLGLYGGFSQAEFDASCKASYSQCGDGAISPDEDADCELGNGKIASWCTENCLSNSRDHASPGFAPGKEGYGANGQYLGSSLLYSTPSVCGDGPPTGIGEDPECEKTLTEDHKGMVDPWVLTLGVGKGSLQILSLFPGTTTLAQATDIIGSTNYQTKGGAIVSGSGSFIIPCGYHNDADCQSAFGSDSYGVGADSCCYRKPKLLSTIPTDNATNVCRNTYIEATFDTVIDPATLSGNLLIARGVSGTSSTLPVPLYRGNISNAKDARVKLNGAMKVAIVDSYAYIAASTNNAIEVVNVATPAAPKHVTTIENNWTLINPQALLASGNYLYVAAQDTFQIIDINKSDITKPILLGALKDQQIVKLKTARLKGSAHSIALSGNIAYVTSYDANALQIIDVSDKNNPLPLASMVDQEAGPNWNKVNLAGVTSIAVQNNYAYIAMENGTMQVLDVHDLSMINALGSLGGLGSIKDIVVRGDYVYVPSYSDNAVRVIDVKDKNKPILIAKFDNNKDGIARLSNPSGIAILGNYLYVVASDATNKIGSSGLEIIDISSSTLPRHAGALSLPGAQPNSIMLSHDAAYVSTYLGGTLEIIDVADFGLFGSRFCQNEVTNLIAIHDKNSNVSVPWYQRLFVRLTNFIHYLMGNVAGAANLKPSRWCVGDDFGSARVLTSPVTSTSRIIITLKAPLIPDNAYALIFKDGIKDIRGVSIGTSTKSGEQAINTQFATREGDLCQIQRATISPSSLYFSSANATDTLQATAFSAGNLPIQPLSNYYDWQYQWGPMENPSVGLEHTSSSVNIATAKNRNGEVDIWAAATIVTDEANHTFGIQATGRAHAIVFLCEHPWPPKDLFINQQGPYVIVPYEDKIGNNDGYDSASSSPSFTNNPLPPTNPVIGDGYFNFSAYYCADKGSPGTFDDLPYLRPVVYVASSTLRSNNRGVCSTTGKACKVNTDCPSVVDVKGKDFIIPYGFNGVCGAAATSSPSGFDTYLQPNDSPLACVDGSDCMDDSNFVKWKTPYPSWECLAPPNLTIDRGICQINDPLKRFIFTNNQNSDAIGIQIFANPHHLSIDDWFQGKKISGGQEYAGSAQRLADGIGGYATINDGSNYYVDALNYATTTNGIYTNVYEFSINSDAKPETRAVFEKLLKNVRFNINLSNFGYCGVTIDKPLMEQQCSNDFDCPTGQVCSAQLDKLKRNFLRLQNLKTIDSALYNYKESQGSYPALKDGTYLKGQTLSVWPSWSVLGNAVGRDLPGDPINKLGAAGTCMVSSSIFCTRDSDCPIANNSPTTCLLHNVDTGWSTADRRFSFACATSSYAYRYIYDKSKGYELRAHLEDDGLAWKNFSSLFSSFDFKKPANINFGVNFWSGSLGICDQTEEISTFNSGICGDKVVNWDKQENCDPPGQTRYSSCLNDQVNIDVCNNKCQWISSSTISCADLSKLLNKCGNGIKDPGEKCDDGKMLNGTYNNCDKDCQGFGTKNGFCGDGIVQSSHEICDVNSASAGAHCEGGPQDGQYCQNDIQCNTSFNIDGKDIWDGVYFNHAWCDPLLPPTPETDFDCSLYSNFPNGDTAKHGFQDPAVAKVDLLIDKCSGENCSLTMTPEFASYFSYKNKFIPLTLPVRAPVGRCVGLQNIAKNGIIYALQKKNSCNFDCQSYGPFCGDGVVQKQFGEDCESNSSCEIENQPGERRCQSCRFVDKGVAAWWRFNDPVTIRDAALYFFLDSSPNHLTASCTGSECPAPTADGAHSLYDFDGKNNFVTVPHNDAIMPSSSFSIEAWIKPSSFSDNWERILEKGGYNVGGGYDVEINPWNRRVRLVLWRELNGSTLVESKVPVDENKWTHIVGTYSPQEKLHILKLYLNGVLDSTAEIFSEDSLRFANSQPLTIGKAGDPKGGSFFAGSIGEVRIYNRALSDSEVVDHFNNTTVCEIKNFQTKTVKLAVKGSCGDGVINPGTELCDNGDKNGVACIPGYERSCSYCSANCLTIDVSPTAFCGNGKIELEGNEKCDVYNANGATTLYSANADPIKTVTQKDNLHQGYSVLNCEQETPEPYLVKKGSKACVNHCSAIIVKETSSASCIKCGLTDSANSSQVDGGIINALEPTSANPLYVTSTAGSLTEWGTLNLFVGPTLTAQSNVAALYFTPGYDNASYYLAPAGQSVLFSSHPDHALLSTNDACWKSDPKYTMMINSDIDDAFTFPVVPKPSSWQYDLILSPVIQQSIRPDDIRVVVSWVGDAKLYSGFFKPQNFTVTRMIEGATIKGEKGVITGRQYYQVVDNKGESMDMMGLWYHGLGRTTGKTNSEAFTLGTGFNEIYCNNNDCSQGIPPYMTANSYAFYIRSPGPIKNLIPSGNVKVDVYLAKNTKTSEDRFFDKPFRTYNLSSAQLQDNPNATFWYVFNVHAGANLAPSDRLNDISKLVTDFSKVYE